ncbi:MAG: LysR substrate-binding domain-containing protein, partial [Telluria sp.]|nr:LysR substrate-binding domain-containing protein [Telluria sp.]
LTWKFSHADGKDVVVHMNSRMLVDSPGTVLALVERGAGIAALEGLTLQASLKAGTLLKVLPEWTLPKGGMYAVLPPGKHVPPKVRAFIDFYRFWLDTPAPKLG